MSDCSQIALAGLESLSLLVFTALTLLSAASVRRLADETVQVCGSYANQRVQLELRRFLASP